MNSLFNAAFGVPTPEFTWTLDGITLEPKRFEKLLIGQYVTFTGEVISHVNISSVTVNDGGDYECKAKSKAGYDIHSSRLNVYGLPVTRSTSGHILSAVAGKVLKLKCPVGEFDLYSFSILYLT